MRLFPGWALASWIAARSEQVPNAVSHSPLPGTRSGSSPMVLTAIRPTAVVAIEVDKSGGATSRARGTPVSASTTRLADSKMSHRKRPRCLTRRIRAHLGHYEECHRCRDAHVRICGGNTQGTQKVGARADRGGQLHVRIGFENTTAFIAVNPQLAHQGVELRHR